MRLNKLEFGALFSYSPHGETQEASLSRSVRTAIKNDEFVFSSGKQIPMSMLIAESIQNPSHSLPFGYLFDPAPILVPARSSSLMKSNSLWVPMRIATALKQSGLGREVSKSLDRTKSLPKSATSDSATRPTAAQQYDSLEVQKLLTEPESILLVDDVVATGATLIGAANRLLDVYPKARIAAFAALRTVTKPEDFRGINESVRGINYLIPFWQDASRPLMSGNRDIVRD